MVGTGGSLHRSIHTYFLFLCFSLLAIPHYFEGGIMQVVSTGPRNRSECHHEMIKNSCFLWSTPSRHCIPVSPSACEDHWGHHLFPTGPAHVSESPSTRRLRRHRGTVNSYFAQVYYKPTNGHRCVLRPAGLSLCLPTSNSIPYDVICSNRWDICSIQSPLWGKGHTLRQEEQC